MALREGINLALDRILKTAEGVQTIPEPEQLERLPTQAPKPLRIPQQLLAEPTEAPPEEPKPLRIPTSLFEGLEPMAPPEGLPPTPLEEQEVEVETETGESVKLTVKTDGSIWRSDLEFPSIPTGTPIRIGNVSEMGEFVPLSEDEIWQQLMDIEKGKEFKFGTIPVGFYKLLSDAPWLAETLNLGTEALTKIFEVFRFPGTALYAEALKEKGIDVEGLAVEKKAKIQEQYEKGEISWMEMQKQRMQADIGELEEMGIGGEIREEYEKLPWYAQLGFELPVFGALGGLSATSLRAVLAPVIAKGGLKAGLARIPSAVVAPVAGLEKILGQIIVLPFKGASKLAGLFRKSGDKELADAGFNIINRAKAGETIPESELTKIASKDPEAAKVLQGIIDEIKVKPKVPPPKAEVKPPVAPELKAVETKVSSLIEKAKPARKELEAIKSIELRKKIPEFTRRLEAAKTFDEAAASRIALRDKLIPPGADIIPIADRFSAEEVAHLINAVNVSEVFAARPLTRANILDALKRVMVDGKLPTETELELIGKIFPGIAEAILKRRPLSAKAWNLFLELANLPRAILASGDLSASLRQMVLLAPRYPVKAVRATWTGARAGWSTLWYRDYATTLDKAIHASRFAPVWEEARLYVAPLEGVVKMAKREEAYMSSVLSRLARDWPHLGLLKKIVTAPALPVAKLTQVSEAAFISTLNKMRTDVFSKYAALWESKATLGEFRALAEVINIGTGRGVVPRPIEGLVPILNTVLFSTRLQLARVEALGWPVTLWKYPPRVRKMVIGNIVAFIGTVSGILGVLELGGLSKMEKDPRSADFGKVRIGNTRLDPWGGFQQYVVLLNRLLSGELKTAEKRLIDIDREDTLIRFLGMKLAPAVGFIRDIFRGETFLGEELTMETEDVQKQAYERLVPMFMRDVMDAMREDGWTGALTASPGFFGVGVVSYPSKTFADWLTVTQEFTGKEWTTEEMIEMRPDFSEAEASWLEFFELPSGRTKDRYLENNPDIEATLYFWGEVKSLSTPESRDKVNELLKKYNLPEDILPIREIEPWEPEDKTEVEIYGDLLNMVPKYFSDYIQENEEEWKGKDITKLIPQIEELKTADRILLDKYNRIALGEEKDFTDAYLKDNPDVDAARLFWYGYKTNHSSKALEILREKADALGIPYDAIPALQKKGVVPKIIQLG